MMTRKTKVVPPVTPRIVPADTGPRALRYGLLVCAFLGTAWSSYEYGRTQAPGSGEETATQSGELQQRFAALQRERDALEEQLTDLQQVLEQDQRNLAAQRARSRVLQQSQTAPRQSPAAEPQSEPETPATEQAAANHALTLENVRIAGTESENLFRLAFSVTRDRDDNERVTGTIWIAVNGTSGGKPTRLSLKSLSPQRRSFVTMGFTQQQEVTEELVLPDDFLPRNILIEAKPYGDRYTRTSESFDWGTSG
jgi:hypothetical protein